MSSIALCPQCRREIPPQLKEPSWHRDVHRAAASNMVTEPDPRAERIKARKSRKGQPLRALTRSHGFATVAKLFLDTRNATIQSAPSEDCPTCLRIQGKVA